MSWYKPLLKNKENKFKAKREERSGRSFASKAEACLFDYLTALHKDGQLILVACQEQIKLTKANIVYIPDFTIEENGQKIWCEMKGFETDVWRLKKRLWEHYGPGELRIYRAKYLKNGPSIVLTETIHSKASPHPT